MTSPESKVPSQKERAKQVEDLLRQVDALIESGGHDAAFELIRRAQALDPENRFALAFVGRIQKLMTARKARASSGGPKPASQFAPKAQVKVGEAPPSAKKPPEGASSTPSESVTMRLGGEQRRAALRAAIDHILARAREFRDGRNFDRALSELERARVLDPSSEAVEALAAEIRKERDDERARMTEEQRRRAEGEEQRKQEALEQELARLRQEKEAERKNQENARSEAQKERIGAYLKSAEQLMNSGKLEEAANQLAFVVVIDPLNAAAAELQRKIREVHDRKRREEMEQRKRKEEEEIQRQVAVRTAIQKNIEAANALAAGGKFNEALRIITRAYMVDPLNEEIRACEQRILAAQEESYRVAEEERRAAEEAMRRQQEEELRRLTEAERERLLREQDEVLEQEKKVNKEKIGRHLARAREHIAAKAYHDALAEVAQAFTVDPFDDDVRAVEQEVMSAQRRDEEAVEAAETAPAQEESSDRAQAEEHLELARSLRAQGEFARALDEITKAFAADPLNKGVQALEAEIEAQIREAERLTNPGQVAPPPPPPQAENADDAQKVLYHVIRARKLMENGAFEDALAEVALGLTLDAENQDLRQMEAAIWEFQNSVAASGPATSAEENTRLVNLHLAAAEEFQQKGNYDRALDEIAKAYQVDPLNAEIKKRENLIRQDELRRNHPGETPLKLVYPKKGAAGGTI
jgi:tetratricopeptide (TPR) repeat protein